MNLGLSQMVSVDGTINNAQWHIIDANLIKGRNHEVLVYDYAVDRTQLTKELNEAVLKQPYSAMFEVHSKNLDITQYVAEFEVAIKAVEEFPVRSFILTADDKPWAICILENDVEIKTKDKTYFDFELKVSLFENSGFIKNPWLIKADGGSSEILFGATTGIIDTNEHDVVVSRSKKINSESTKDDIINHLNQGNPYKPHTLETGEYIKLKLRANNANSIKGFKAIFIRILWNLGIIMYIERSKTYGTDYPNLTLPEGKDFDISYRVDFDGDV